MAVVLASGLASRLLTGWNTPFWLDETYTGAIAIQPSFTGLVRDCLNELGGPVYYALMWVWEKIAGASNTVLRLPSLVFSVTAPLLILWKGHPDRDIRLLWAALVFLWLPGIHYASEARSYSLLLLEGAAQAIAFLALMRAPSLRRAAIWCGISAVLILTHYHGGLLAGLQGLIYLAVHRGKALRTWPAALIFVPVAAWMAVHLPLLFRFASPDVAWQQVLSFGDLRLLPAMLFGSVWLTLFLVVAVAVTLPFLLARSGRGEASFAFGAVEVATVGASLVAILLVIAAGFVRPSFSGRYLIPFIPGLLLGIALWAAHAGRRWPVLRWMLLAVLLALNLRELAKDLGDPKRDPRWAFSFEQASADLAARGAGRILFLWDNPTTAIANPKLMRRVGGFFLSRTGSPVPLETVILAGRGRDTDPNAELARRATRPGDAILWIYDTGVPGTRALTRPPRLSAFDAGWRCRNYGRESVHIVACLRPDQAAAVAG